MKKVGSIWLVLLLMISVMMLPAQAVSDNAQEVKVVHTVFGDVEIETRTVVYDLLSRSSSRRADKVAAVKFGGKVIAEVTLSATFGYDGTTSWVIDTGSSHTTNSGWSYGSEKITTTSGKASLSAILSHLLWADADVNISITCSPTGQIS